MADRRPAGGQASSLGPLTVGAMTFNTTLETRKPRGGSRLREKSGRRDMRLASYNMRGRPSFGAVVGDGIVDLRPRLGRYSSLLEIFRTPALAEAKAAAE